VRKTGMYYFVDIHLEVDGNITVEKGHKIGHDFKNYVMYKIPEISDVLVHIEPVINNSKINRQLIEDSNVF
jgi:divalent metal cation (Fe/Co/Zn/Cd) transporter